MQLQQLAVLVIGLTSIIAIKTTAILSNKKTGRKLFRFFMCLFISSLVSISFQEQLPGL